MMEQILFLHGDSNRGEKTRSFLELGGYEIQEENIEQFVKSKLVNDKLKYSLQMIHAVLIEGEDIGYYAKLCKKLRTITDKPILILSKKGEEWEKTQMFQAGVNDYMVSPYLRTELIARIRAHIACYKRLTHDIGVIQIKNLVIDVFDRKVFVDNKVVPFRVKEFDILMLLVKNSNRVVTKEEIYQIIWKNTEFIQPYSNTVAVHIKRIRDKIEADADNPQFLQTVWGVGYRFLNPNIH